MNIDLENSVKMEIAKQKPPGAKVHLSPELSATCAVMQRHLERIHEKFQRILPKKDEA